jgi:hypothetical protein
MLPAFRSSNISPGRAPVIRAGITRESEQVMNNASGNCPTASFRYSSLSKSTRRLNDRARSSSAFILPP